jgi:hypothetical protein
MTDFLALARDALAAEVSKIDDDSPSLAAIYHLDPLLTFNDLWQDVRCQLRDRWTTPRIRDGWRTALLGAPPDDAFWIHSFDRMRGRGSLLVDAERSWQSKPPDRMFHAHHYIASGVDGVAAIHLMLLSDLDPVAAVEFVATRSSEYLIWAGVGMLDLGENEELVNEVLLRSECRDAVLLALACALDQQWADLQRQANAIRWTHTDATVKAEAQASLDLHWREGIPARHSAIAKRLAARVDAGAILGPWMRHLVLSSDLTFDVKGAEQPVLARIALDALSNVTGGIELKRSVEPSVACLAARAIAANGREDQLERHWQEWVDLVLGEDDSLARCGEVSWSVAGDTLASLPDPLSAWRSLTTKLQPLMRRRARRGGWEYDDVVFPLVIAGVNAAARLGSAGRHLLDHVYDTALRHFLVNQPPENHRSFNLPAYVFAACPPVVSDRAEIDAMLARLPLRTHVALARRQMGVAGGELRADAPSDHEISVRAYLRWLDRGGVDAPEAAIDDWLAAERSLLPTSRPTN